MSRDISIQDIIEAVSNALGVSTHNICSEKRTGDFVKARHIIAFLSEKLTLESYSSIGRVLGGRSRTMITHSVQIAKQKIKNDADFAKIIKIIEHVLLEYPKSITPQVGAIHFSEPVQTLKHVLELNDEDEDDFKRQYKSLSDLFKVVLTAFEELETVKYNHDERLARDAVIVAVERLYKEFQSLKRNKEMKEWMKNMKKNLSL